MNWVVSHLASREILREIIQNGKEGGARKLLAKRKQKFIGGKQEFRAMMASYWLSCMLSIGWACCWARKSSYCRDNIFLLEMQGKSFPVWGN